MSEEKTERRAVLFVGSWGVVVAVGVAWLGAAGGFGAGEGSEEPLAGVYVG